MRPTPTISVVIRNRNEGVTLAEVLRALAMQDVEPGALEVIVVDNESTDDSRAIATAAGATVIDLPKGAFTYGRALNIGIAAASGEFIVILSAHALPLGRHFLRDAVAPFSDPRVAGVRCLYVAKEREVRAWMEPKELASPHDLDAVISRGPLASGCVIRRAVWEQIPFDESLESVEDKYWALQALQRGYVIRGSEAMYLYTRHKSIREAVRESNRFYLALFRFSQVPPPVKLSSVFRSVFVGAPHTAFKVAAQAVLSYAYLKTVPLQARRKPKVGALR
jgi:rhamnosyltransferase